MAVSFHVTDNVPDRWKTWAMSTRSEPASRASRTFGTQLIVNSGPFGCRADGVRRDRRSAGQHLDRQVLGRVVALLVGRKVAGELGLWRPLQLEPDGCGLRCRRRRRLRTGARPMPAARTPALMPGRRAGARRTGAERHRGGRRKGQQGPDLHRIHLSCLLPLARDGASSNTARQVTPTRIMTASVARIEACHGITMRSSATTTR